MSFDLSEYKTVAERIAEFAAKFPDGCLRPVDPARPFEVITVGEQTYIVYVAAAYRSHGDDLPGIGCAWEQYPGQTPYTRGSELQNVETSAWGRAIVAALAADTTKAVASAEDVRSSPQPASGGPAGGRARRAPTSASPKVVERGGPLSPPVTSRAEWEARRHEVTHEGQAATTNEDSRSAGPG